MAFATNEGHAVISWAHHYLTETRRWTSGDADFYLSRDKRLLEVAEELWVCGPPSVSSGTRFEIVAATEFGIPITLKPEWMHENFNPLQPDAPLVLPPPTTDTRELVNCPLCEGYGCRSCMGRGKIPK